MKSETFLSMAFEEVLDRFAPQFIEPLMSRKNIEVGKQVLVEEGPAADNFRNKNLEMLRCLSNPKCAFSKHPIGSRESLNKKNMQGDKADQQIINHFNTWYTAEKMSLCIVCNHSLDTMEQWVVEKFSEIYKAHVAVPLKSKDLKK